MMFLAKRNRSKAGCLLSRSPVKHCLVVCIFAAACTRAAGAGEAAPSWRNWTPSRRKTGKELTASEEDTRQLGVSVGVENLGDRIHTIFNRYKSALGTTDEEKEDGRMEKASLCFSRICYKFQPVHVRPDSIKNPIPGDWFMIAGDKIDRWRERIDILVEIENVFPNNEYSVLTVLGQRCRVRRSLLLPTNPLKIIHDKRYNNGDLERRSREIEYMIRKTRNIFAEWTARRNSRRGNILHAGVAPGRPGPIPQGPVAPGPLPQSPSSWQNFRDPRGFGNQRFQQPIDRDALRAQLMSEPTSRRRGPSSYWD